MNTLGMRQFEEHKRDTPSLSHEEDQQYVYQPLKGPDIIRIVKLHDTAGRIACSLQQIDYSEGGYQALSYVWGDEERPFKAFVRDELGKQLGYIPLTTNLQSALYDLLHAKDVENKVFWIDQLCIDQKGNEKNHQVSLMRQIYQHASRVITYVGPAVTSDDEETSGVVLLNLLNNHYAEDLEPILQAGSLTATLVRRVELPVLKLPKEIKIAGDITDPLEKRNEEEYVVEGWRWMLRAAYGQWTQRLWIVQEQCLNKETTLLHGQLLLSWDAVATISLLFALRILPARYLARFWQDQYPHSRLTSGYFAESTYQIWRQRQLYLRGLDAISQDTLLGNMARYEAFKCRDPRDHVFALLALSTDAVDLAIIPNYSDHATTHHVFLDTSIRILRVARKLSLLNYACRWARFDLATSDFLPEATSPSWTLGPFNHPFPRVLLIDGGSPHPQNTLSSPPRFLIDKSILVVKGQVVDGISISTSVVFIPPSFSIGPPDKPLVHAFSLLLSNWSSLLLHLGLSLENAACLCRAIVASIGWIPALNRQGQNAVKAGAFYFGFLYQDYLKFVSKAGPEFGIDVSAITSQGDRLLWDLRVLLLESKSELDGFDPREPTRNPIHEDVLSEMRRYSVLHGRSFCTTEAGRVCNAMYQPKRGDVIAALQGSTTLFVLRPVGDKYRLVGDVYVDGLMDGEAYEGVDPLDVDHDIELV